MAIQYQQFIDYLFYKSTLSGAPMSGTFELTSRCNLDCRMCYIHKRAAQRAFIKQVVNELLVLYGHFRSP